MPAVQTQDLIYNETGQSFEFDAPSRPASIGSVSVFHRTAGDDGTAETATTGSAAIETTPNTTFDASSGMSESDPTILRLAATTGIVAGRMLLATDTQGRTEWVDVVGVTDGASATARSGLRLDYVSGDTLEGTRCSISVLDAWIQDANKITDGTEVNAGWRVRWEWDDAAGVTHVDFTDVDVVRYRGADHGVTPTDMQRFMAWDSMLPRSHRDDGGQAIIDAAFDRVNDDLFALGIPDQQIRNRDRLGRVVQYAAQRQLAWVLLMLGGDPEKYTAADAEYQGFFNKVFRVETKVAIGDSSGGAANDKVVSPAGVWKR